MPDPDPAVLLALHRPVVQYDSLESYYTDWAAVITDRPGNALKREDGTVIATAGPPTSAAPVLNLAFLHPNTYPNGQPVKETDYIDETGSDYVTQARDMHARSGYANKAHGRLVNQHGTIWLQYWLFMYYDDPGFLALGTHEGDVEMIQIRLDETGQPDAVTYSQHRSGVSARWDQVEKEGSAPVVYSARGTHASMLRGGDLESNRALIPDHNDGRGPRVRLDLISLSQAQTPWAYWPGRWGGTRPQVEILGQVGVEANSPVAPNRHKAWGDPAAFHGECDASDLPPIGETHGTAAPKPPAPELQVQVDRAANVAAVNFNIPPAEGAAQPSKLVIGVQASDGVKPPATTVVHLTGESGELQAPLPPDAPVVEVLATTHSVGGGISDTATAVESAAR